MQACLHNRPPNDIRQWRSKRVYTIEIQTGCQTMLDNGDPSRCTQRRSKAMQACLHNENINDNRQWRSKPVHTTEIQGNASLFAQQNS